MLQCNTSHYHTHVHCGCMLVLPTGHMHKANINNMVFLVTQVNKKETGFFILSLKFVFSFFLLHLSHQKYHHQVPMSFINRYMYNYI